MALPPLQSLCVTNLMLKPTAILHAALQGSTPHRCLCQTPLPSPQSSEECCALRGGSEVSASRAPVSLIQAAEQKTSMNMLTKACLVPLQAGARSRALGQGSCPGLSLASAAMCPVLLGARRPSSPWRAQGGQGPVCVCQVTNTRNLMAPHTPNST